MAADEAGVMWRHVPIELADIERMNRSQKTLDTIIMDSCTMTDDVSVEFCKFLARNDRLRTLDLHECKFGLRQYRRIFVALESATGLETLSLTDKSYYDATKGVATSNDIYHAIIPFLADNKGFFTILNLGIPITQIDFIRFVLAMSHNTVVEVLTMDIVFSIPVTSETGISFLPEDVEFIEEGTKKYYSSLTELTPLQKFFRENGIVKHPKFGLTYNLDILMLAMTKENTRLTNLSGKILQQLDFETKEDILDDLYNNKKRNINLFTLLNNKIILTERRENAIKRAYLAAFNTEITSLQRD